MFVTATQVGGCSNADQEGRLVGEMQNFSVPAGNRFKYILSEKSATYYACIYSEKWFKLLHIVWMEYLCVDNHGIMTQQPWNFSQRGTLENGLWRGQIIMTLAMVETELQRQKVLE